MKLYPTLLSIAVLGLFACSQEPAGQAPAETASAPASSPAAETDAAASAQAASAPASGEMCNIMVDSDDAMKYNTAEINISKACPSVTITLKHVGKMPKAAMGHNIVIAKSEDVDEIVKNGASAGADENYLKAGDEKVIAATKLIGGGEEDSVTVATDKFSDGNQYEFFCSFPGHLGLMRGKVNLVE